MHRNRGARSADPRRDLVSEHHASAGAHHWPARNSWKNRADGTSVSPSRACRTQSERCETQRPCGRSTRDSHRHWPRHCLTPRSRPSDERAHCASPPRRNAAVTFEARGVMVRRRPETAGPGVQPGSVGGRGDRLGRVDGPRQAAAVRLPTAPRPNAQRSFRRHSPDPLAGTRSTPGPSPRNALHAPQFGPSRGAPRGTAVRARLGHRDLATVCAPLVARWIRPCCSPWLLPVSVPVTALDSPRGRRRI